MRNPDLACFSDPMLVEQLLDYLSHGNTAAADPLAAEVLVRGLSEKAAEAAKRRLASKAWRTIR